MAELVCDCGMMDLVTDAGFGQVTCRACGVVVEAVVLDDHMEQYSEAVGPRANVMSAVHGDLLPCAPTVLNHKSHNRRHMSNPDPHASIRRLFDAIDTWGRSFSLDVRELAKLMCRDSMARKVVRQDSWPLYAAAALYMATKWRGGGQGRSKSEIVGQFAQFNIDESELVRIAKQLRHALRGQPYAESLGRGLQPRDLINRCVDNMGIGEKAVRERVKTKAHDVMLRIPEKSVEGKTPNSICSGVVYYVLQQEGVHLKKKALAQSCNVSVATLDKMHATITSLLT
jgi:transcription initiation factor TFIIIB Brf1 subunit/transcription initiation factor TFIIB